MDISTLLNLIAEVDQNDHNSLKTINDQTSAYAYYTLKMSDEERIVRKPQFFTTHTTQSKIGSLNVVEKHWKSAKQYTESVDAVRSIRPQGYYLSSIELVPSFIDSVIQTPYSCTLVKGDDLYINGLICKTEILAELYATLKAIQHESLTNAK